MLASPIVRLWLGCRGELHINAKLTEVFSHSPKEDGRCVTGGIKVKLENWDCSWLLTGSCIETYPLPLAWGDVY